MFIFIKKLIMMYMKQERERRCLEAINQGYRYIPETGKIIGKYNREITKHTDKGYISISLKIDNKYINLMGHQFAWYFVNKECVDLLDHINEIKDDNRIENLRKSSKQENAFNQSKVKGYSFNKRIKKFTAYIKIDGIKKHIGVYDNEIDARNAYLDMKEKLHKYTN